MEPKRKKFCVFMVSNPLADQKKLAAGIFWGDDAVALACSGPYLSFIVDLSKKVLIDFMKDKILPTIKQTEKMGNNFVKKWCVLGVLHVVLKPKTNRSFICNENISNNVRTATPIKSP